MAPAFFGEAEEKKYFLFPLPSSYRRFCHQKEIVRSCDNCTLRRWRTRSSKSLQCS
ncbi:hypothetical protein M569_17676 [Genlisea aurea]|uniref:Sema domain-containing protein n=1 Tax=Genlisea aurea TaxID=192259 RepID=S8BR90_9LAMI|nr:hypothetical protein M569_17676 [Genlisea aurea]